MTHVVVVGGGIIGAACARELALRGARVTLVERSSLASGASGRNHGLLLVPPDPLLVPMARASLEVYRGLAPEAAVPVRLDDDPIGFLIVAGEDAAERAAARAEAEAVAASGVAVQALEGGALRDAEPGLSEELVEGWLLDDGRRLDPAALTVSLALAARDAGAEVRTQVPVRAVLTSGARVTGVATDEGVIEAGTVVVAGGPWSPPLLRPLGMSVPVAGARGWLLHLAAEPETVRHLVERGGWHTLAGERAWRPLEALRLSEGEPDNELGTLVQPNPDATVLVGGSMQRTVAAEPEDHSTPRRLAAGAAAVLPALAGAEVLGAWWGIRPLSPDGRPIIGRLAEGLVVATAHGSQGVILGGGTARLVAAEVLGDPPPLDPGPFAPGRFGPGVLSG